MADLNQDFDFYSSESRSVTFQVTGAMTAPTFVWKVAVNEFAAALISKNGSLSQSAINTWTATINLAPSDFVGLSAGVYGHWLLITDLGGADVAATGALTFHGMPA